MPNSNITLDSLRKRKKYRETPLRYRVDDFAFVTVSGGIKATEVNLDTNYEGENIKIRGYPDRGLNLSLDWDDSRLDPLESTYSDQINLIPGGRVDVLPYFNNTTNCSGIISGEFESIYVSYIAEVEHTLESIAVYCTEFDPESNSQLHNVVVTITPGYYSWATNVTTFSFAEFENPNLTVVSGWNKFNFATDDLTPYNSSVPNIQAPLNVPVGAQVTIEISNNVNFSLGWNTDQPGYNNVIDPRIKCWYEIDDWDTPDQMFFDVNNNKSGCLLFMINPTDDFKPQLIYGRYNSDKIPFYIGGSTTPIAPEVLTYDIPSGGRWVNYQIPRSGLTCTFSGVPGDSGDNAFSTDFLNSGFCLAGIFVKPDPLSLIVRPVLWTNAAEMTLGGTVIHYLDGHWVYNADPSYRLVGVIDPYWVTGNPTLINSGNCRVFSNLYNKVRTPVDSGDIFSDGTTQDLTGDWEEIDNISVSFYGASKVDLYASVSVSGQGELTFKQLTDTDDSMEISGYTNTYTLNTHHCLPGYATNGNIKANINTLDNSLSPLWYNSMFPSEIGLAVRTDSTGAVLLKDGLYKGARIKGWVEI